MYDAKGRIIVVGIGPGDPAHLTYRAHEALMECDVIVGYKTYLNLIRPLLRDQGYIKEIVASGMRQEIERASKAVELAESGKKVAVISSGDAGIYGMAGLLFEVARQRGWRSTDIEVVPGVSALNAAAALLGAPLMHDFAVISLSDLMTPWETIARRLEAAAQADFVIVLYNPKSTGRIQQFVEAQRIIKQFRKGTTPVGVVTAAYRDRQQVTITDLDNVLNVPVGMQSTIIIGNSSSTVIDGRIITPRGYRIERIGEVDEECVSLG